MASTSMKYPKKGVKWSKQMVSKLLQLYRQNECLWNIYSSDHKNKTLRNKAYDNIFRGIPGVTLKDIKIKIKNIRSFYYHELRKMENFKHGDHEPYVPTVKWFEFVDSFLKDVISLDKISHDDDKEEKYIEMDDEEEGNYIHYDFLEDDDTLEMLENDNFDVNKQKRTVMLPENSVPYSTEQFDTPKTYRSHKIRKNVEKSSTQCDDDEFDAFAKLVAKQLRQLPLQDALETQVEIQKLINSVRFKKKV